MYVATHARSCVFVCVCVCVEGRGSGKNRACVSRSKPRDKYQILMGRLIIDQKLERLIIDLGPELQCLLRVKEDLSLVLSFQDANDNVLVEESGFKNVKNKHLGMSPF